MRILILNGPNLNLLGRREPEIYGSQNFDTFLETLRPRFPQVALLYFQSNHEGVLIDRLQESDGHTDGIVFNPAGYSHTSIALADTISTIAVPVVEVHISNIHEREPFRHHSYTAAKAAKTIIGQGLEGYAMAIEWLLSRQQ